MPEAKRSSFKKLVRYWYLSFNLKLPLVEACLKLQPVLRAKPLLRGALAVLLLVKIAEAR